MRSCDKIEKTRRNRWYKRDWESTTCESEFRKFLIFSQLLTGHTGRFCQFGTRHKSTQPKPQAERHEADVKRRNRRGEAEFDLVLAGRELDAAHDVIAAQQRLGFAVHPNLPIRIKVIVQKQDRGDDGVGVHLDSLRRVIGYIDGAGNLVGGGAGRRPWDWVLHQDRSGWIKARLGQLEEIVLLVGIDLPI